MLSLAAAVDGVRPEVGATDTKSEGEISGAGMLSPSLPLLSAGKLCANVPFEAIIFLVSVHPV